MKRPLVTLFLVFSLFETVYSQVLPYAREIVKTLSSQEFKGRGYVEQGDKIAAAYIQSHFKQLALKPFGENYNQQFSTPVNTFPGELVLKINGEHLVPGKDYLVGPGSPPVTGRFTAMNVSLHELKNGLTPGVIGINNREQVLVIDESTDQEFTQEESERITQIKNYLKYNNAGAAPVTLFLSADKLTWSGSTRQFTNPSFTLKRDHIQLPVKSVEIAVEPVFEENYSTQNVIGYLEGERTDSMVVLIAHYDHFGKMGNALFPGANDNASGVAMLLSLAKHYSENRPEFTTVFIAFGAEEIGLIGSRYFVENPPFDLSKIKFLLNFDLAGTGDEGIQVVNGSVYKGAFERLSQINDQNGYVPEVRIRGSACNSDHCNFDKVNVPGFYIYTLGGIRSYHDIYDRYETLPFTEFEGYYELMVDFLSTF